MRLLALLALLAIGLFVGTSTAAPVPKEKPKDEEVILGTWQAEKSDEGGGKGLPAEKLAKVRLTFKKDGKFTLTDSDGDEAEGAYKLDPTGKAIDFTPERGPTVLGLYTLDGDTLTVVTVNSGKGRPAEFKADAATSTVVNTLKRITVEKKDK